MKKPVFSIGMIFKNEIRCLERCLKSLQPLRDAIPCELVMADTGSSDGSRAVAEKYADILFDFPWIDDFSAARNAVMDRCSGVWYFSIDADEWLGEDIAELIAFGKTKNLPQDFAGVNIRNYRSVGLERDQNYLDFTGIRLARLSSGVRYQNCIHETWKSPDGGPLKVMPLDDVWLYHDGYAYPDKQSEQAKRERNMFLLKKKLDEDPKNFQTILECIDSSKQSDPDASVAYARRAVQGIDEKWPGWEKSGVLVFHRAVSVAQLHNLPEAGEWIEYAAKNYPDSIFTRVDTSYYAFSYHWGKKNYRDAARWGEAYLKGLADYKAGRYDGSEMMRGVLEYISPFWRRKVVVLLPQAYLECGEGERAFQAFQNILSEELEDAKQIELCVLMLLRIHRTTLLDTRDTAARFWEQISRPEPDAKIAKERQKVFCQTAASALTPAYQHEEEGRADFLRHGCQVFAPLTGKCELGTAVAVLETEDRRELDKWLGSVENWDEFPALALEHALLEGAAFPLPEKPLNIEEMDQLASRMIRRNGPLTELAILAADKALTDWQSLAWARGLAMAAVKSCDWTDGKQDMELCRAFAKIEGAFLPRYYAAELLCDENIRILPPMHRFGWCCERAFQALDAKDSAGYVRLLRQGLELCPEMRSMAEFLLKQLKESRKAQAAPELLILAEQVRTMLARYPADDPAVEALKQSAAYRQVAHLIEGPDPGIFRGLPQ